MFFLLIVAISIEDYFYKIRRVFQEVSHNEWQELFVIIHRICTWVVEGSRLATVNLFSEINQHVSAVYRVSNLFFVTCTFDL